MSSEQNKTLVRRYFEEIWNKGDLAAADEVLAPSFGGLGMAMCGLEAVKIYISSYKEAFPAARFTILSMIPEDADTVTVAWALSHGTPPGQGKVATGISVYRISCGKIVEGWAASDALGEMRKLGAAPALAPSA